MRNLLSEIEAAMRAVDEHDGDRVVRRALPAARPAAIERLRRKWGVLPKGYEDFLRIANGWENFAFGTSVIGADGPTRDRLDALSKKLRARRDVKSTLAADREKSKHDRTDFCPESKRLALATYAGFVHVYDPYVEELPGRIDGFRARREIARWILWEHLPNGPIRW